jgi:hypothetical protein
MIHTIGNFRGRHTLTLTLGVANGRSIFGNALPPGYRKFGCLAEGTQKCRRDSHNVAYGTRSSRGWTDGVGIETSGRPPALQGGELGTDILDLRAYGRN